MREHSGGRYRLLGLIRELISAKGGSVRHAELAHWLNYQCGMDLVTAREGSGGACVGEADGDSGSVLGLAARQADALYGARGAVLEKSPNMTRDSETPTAFKS